MLEETAPAIHSESDIRQIRACAKEIANSMARIDGERDFQKEALNALKEEVDIKPVWVRQLARIYHKQNKELVEQKNDALLSLYEQVFGISEDNG
jgi:fumarylacetoacetate (FAA) hydrolase family protein